MSSVSVDSARLGKVKLNVEETRITGSLRQQNTRSGGKKGRAGKRVCSCGPRRILNPAGAHERHAGVGPVPEGGEISSSVPSPGRGSFKSWENERVTPNAFQLAAYQTVFMQD